MPNITGLTSAGNQTAAQSSAASDVTRSATRPEMPLATEEPPSVFTIEVLGYGGGEG